MELQCASGEEKASQLVLADGSMFTSSAQPQFSIQPEELQRLVATFDSLGKNEDGHISRAEIIKAMRTEHEVRGCCSFCELL